MAMLLISFLAVSFCYAFEKHHCSLGKGGKSYEGINHSDCF